MSGRERKLFLNEIAQQDLPSIFQAMLNAERVENDPLKQMALRSTLGNALRFKTPSQEFLEQMRAFITNNSNLDFERQMLIGALESAATKDSVELLLKIAANSSEKAIREAAGSLAGVGDLGRGGEELAPVLERTWRETSDPNLIWSTSSTMARIGTQSSIELLLTAALATDDQQKVRFDAAQRALQEIYLPNAVPALAARLGDQPPTSPTAKLVVPILVKIGDITAGKAVLGWLRERSEDVTPLIKDLIVQRTLNPAMLEAWDSALDTSMTFRIEQNREAIRAGIAAYRAGRTLQR